MKRSIIYAFIFILLAASCELELERIETGANKGPETIFADKLQTREALNHLYSRIRGYSGFNAFSGGTSTPGVLDAATDNGRIANNDGAVQLNMSTLTHNQVPFTNKHLPWRDYYQAIREANLFLKYIDQSPLSADEIETMKVEARFLRSLYYCELFKMYGGLVLMGNEPMDKIAFNENIYRSDIKETVEYIVAELDMLIPIMKKKSEWGDADYGRATRGMAMAYKARTLLYYASPLNTQDESADEIKSRWEAAAQAAKDLMETNEYSLHPNYVELFHTRVNDELILSYLRGMGKQAYTMSLHPNLNPTGSISGSRPTFNAVDGFAMIDGKSPILGYNADGTPKFNPAVTDYDDNDIQKNRDPRLDMNVVFHNEELYINGEHIPIKMDEVITGTETEPFAQNSFFVQKYQDPNFDHHGSGGLDQNYPMLRYGEVLLNFAEASNQAYGPSAEAVGAINQLRNRVGALPLSTNPADWTKESLNEQIVVERRMEMFSEEHRYWDAKRWLKGYEMLGARIFGGNIVNDKYVRYFIEDRVFLSKFYRFPIPTADVYNSGGSIYQNPGW